MSTTQATKKKTTKKSTKKEEPITTTIGLERNGKGWSFVEVKTQGDKIVEKIVGEPTRKSHVFEELKIQVVKRFWRDGDNL